jgi:hypothetical protein
VASGTGIFGGMLMYDTTTPANIPSQCIVNTNTSGSIFTPCTVNVTNGDTIVFYPTITLSQQTTGNIAASTSLTFTNAGSDAQFNGLTTLTNLTVGGQINLFQSTINGSDLPETGPNQPLITVNGTTFLNTYTPPGSNGGNLYMGFGAGPTSEPQGYIGLFQQTNNTAFGDGYVLNNLTSGGSDACFGYQTCQSMNTGAENSIFGTNAGNAITTGIYNTIMGFAFYGNNASGSNNTLIGGLAGSNQSYTQFYNYNNVTAIGATALENINGSGGNNTALGYSAGSAVTSGTNNLVLGYSVASGTLATGSNNILVGTSSATDTPASGSSNEINIGGLLIWNKVSLSAPAVSACGTGSPAIDAHGNNRSGTLTAGGGALTSCTITFAGGGYTTWDHCRVTFHNEVLAGAAYSYTTTVLTVTATSLTGATFDYDCDGY